MHEGSILSTISSALLFCFFGDIHPDGWEVWLVVIFVCVSLMTDVIGHLFFVSIYLQKKSRKMSIFQTLFEQERLDFDEILKACPYRLWTSWLLWKLHCAINSSRNIRSISSLKLLNPAHHNVLKSHLKSYFPTLTKVRSHLVSVSFSRPYHHLGSAFYWSSFVYPAVTLTWLLSFH